MASLDSLFSRVTFDVFQDQQVRRVSAYSVTINRRLTAAEPLIVRTMIRDSVKSRKQTSAYNYPSSLIMSFNAGNVDYAGCWKCPFYPESCVAPE